MCCTAVTVGRSAGTHSAWSWRRNDRAVLVDERRAHCHRGRQPHRATRTPACTGGGGAGPQCWPDNISRVSTATDTVHCGSYVDPGQPILADIRGAGGAARSLGGDGRRRPPLPEGSQNGPSEPAHSGTWDARLDLVTPCHRHGHQWPGPSARATGVLHGGSPAWALLDEG